MTFSAQNGLMRMTLMEFSLIDDTGLVQMKSTPMQIKMLRCKSRWQTRNWSFWLLDICLKNDEAKERGVIPFMIAGVVKMMPSVMADCWPKVGGRCFRTVSGVRVSYLQFIWGGWGGLPGGTGGVLAPGRSVL